MGKKAPHISPISPLYLPYFSHISPQYLSYISPISPIYLDGLMGKKAPEAVMTLYLP